MSRKKTAPPKDLLELEKRRGKNSFKSLSPFSIEIGASHSAKASSTVTDTRTRRNISSVIRRTDGYRNIDEGLVPQTGSAYIGGALSDNELTIHDAIELCQKAYYNIPICKNTVDLMTEFSSTDIYLKGGTKKSKRFFEEYFKAINIHKIQDQFFLEYYRSSNVFMYIHEGSVPEENMRRLRSNFGLSLSAIGSEIPVGYEVLDPVSIHSDGNISFANNLYKKAITGYELSRLRNPKTDQDQMVFDSLPDEVKKQIKSSTPDGYGRNSVIYMDLEAEKVLAVFCKKQPYEPFAIPMLWPVLRDINAKEELKQMDMALARTMQQVVLLITMGYEDKDGNLQIDTEYMGKMRDLFNNQSVSRVLVSDFTTKAEWKIPQISDILTDQKYKILNEDIANGLNYILAGGEKFSNQSIKVKVFLERLRQGREVFKREFLIPEIKKISKRLGFKSYPEPYFQEVDFKDEVQMNRVYTRLVELGVLTAEEGLNAIQTGELPTPSESLESQQEFKKLKDEGLYDPLIGGKNKSETGRPSGTSSPKNPTPTQASENSEKISLSKLKDGYSVATVISETIKNRIKSKYNLKRLGKNQKQIAQELTDNLIINHGLSDWKSHVNDYIEAKFSESTNPQRLSRLHEIMKEHDVDYLDASIILESFVEEE